MKANQLSEIHKFYDFPYDKQIGHAKRLHRNVLSRQITNNSGLASRVLINHHENSGLIFLSVSEK